MEEEFGFGSRVLEPIDFLLDYSAEPCRAVHGRELRVPRLASRCSRLALGALGASLSAPARARGARGRQPVLLAE